MARDRSRLAALLDDVVEPFTELSAEHCHGWGVARWSGSGLAVDREPRAALDSPDFTEALDGTADAALVHLRYMNSEAVGGCSVSNTHPFLGSGYAFAHNGHFQPFDALDELIGTELLATLTGQTDTERYFLRFRQHLAVADPVTALLRTAEEITARADISSLNCLLLGEEALYVYASEDPGSEVSLRRGAGFFDLDYLVERDRVVVASTGWRERGGAWRTIPQGHVLEVRRSTLDVLLHGPRE